MRQFLRAPKTHGKTDGKVLYAIGRILIKCLVCILFLAKLIRENGISKIFLYKQQVSHSGKSATIRESNHGSDVYNEHYT